MIFAECIYRIFISIPEHKTPSMYLTQKYQAACLMWLNFVSLIMGFLILFLKENVKSENISYLALACFGLILFSLWCLKRGKVGLAGWAYLGYHYICSFFGGDILDMDLAATAGLMLTPVIGFVITSSQWIQYLNILVAFWGQIVQIERINKKFMITMSQEQSDEIFYFQLVAFAVLVACSLICSSQARFQGKILAILESNYEKTENISKELVQALEYKNNFLSSFSHEIRNSLNAINSSIDYLLTVVNEAPQVEVLKNARLGGHMALNFVNNILDAARLQNDKIELHSMKTHAFEIIRQVFAINQENTRKKGIQVRAFIDKKMPSILHLDSSRVVQILMNLFIQAMKTTRKNGKILIYAAWCSEKEKSTLLNLIEESLVILQDKSNTSEEDSITEADSGLEGEHDLIPSKKENHLIHSECEVLSTGGMGPRQLNSEIKNKKTLHQVEEFNNYINKNFRSIDPQITSTPRQFHQSPQTQKGYLKFQVSNTGSGVTPSELPKLFSMYAVGTPSNNDDKTTALSLWICQQLCRKMGGDIKAYSQLNEGTSFVFYIPIDFTKNSPQVQIKSSNTKDRVRALVVDDYAYNRDVHKLILEKEGVEIECASNGKEALEKVTQHTGKYYDFIFMDINMPEMDGITSTREIRKFEQANRKEHTDIYFVSANYDAQDIIKDPTIQSEKAVTKFLPKPIDIPTVKKLVVQYSTCTKQIILGKSTNIAMAAEGDFARKKTKSNEIKKVLTRLIKDDSF